MLPKIFYLSGLPMFVWYIGLRWTLLGNELGKITNNILTLDWWQARINFLTALGSIVFLIISLADFNYSFKLRIIYWLAVFICARNIWYVLEDVIDYYSYPSGKQLMFIIIDIIMVINTACWIYIYRSMN
jgi:uncharacterized membrane protein